MAWCGWCGGCSTPAASSSSEARSYAGARGRTERGTEQVEVHWVAVDDGTTDHLRAFIVRPTLAATVHQDDEVELGVTPFLGFVRSARVIAPARPLPPPQALDQLPPPRLVAPLHWTERPEMAGAPGAEDEGPRRRTDVPLVTAVLARQIQRLFAAVGTRR